MQGLRILGVDPGLANMGLALMLYQPGIGVELEELKLIETKKEDKKRKLRAKADDLRRLEIIRIEFSLIVRTWAPDVVAFEEVPNIPNSTLVRKIALAWGTCWALATDRAGVVSFEYPITDLKVAVTGKRTASKQEMVETLSQRYVGLQDAEIAASKKEHVADAMAAALLAAQDPVVIRLAQALDKVSA